MKIKFTLLLLAFAVAISASAQQLEKKLKKLSKEYNFTYEQLETDSLFTEKYLLWFDQPVNHDKHDSAVFRQRVFLSHLDFDAPVVFITEGYAANHAENPKFVSELAGLLNANQICVEHRYFSKSVPDTLKWDQLTVANSTADYHRITSVLKKIYSGKWISTGISKGGQTTIFYRYFYPEDVDISVPYVAPLNFSVEDKRIYRFLKNVGTPECRKRILDFQTELMKHKEKYLPAFEKLAKEKKLTYRMGIEKGYELTVFEYSFAFWQWGYFTCEQIPQDFSNPDSIIHHLDKVAGLKWISNEGIAAQQPFFYQAMREIGMYGYDITPFKPWTTFTKNPTFEFTLPKGVHVTYNPALMEKIDFFVRHKATNMLYLYGEYDPWGATGVDVTYQHNCEKIVKPKGSHRTRINNLPEEQKQFVMNKLKEWLEE